MIWNQFWQSPEFVQAYLHVFTRGRKDDSLQRILNMVNLDIKLKQIKVWFKVFAKVDCFYMLILLINVFVLYNFVHNIYALQIRTPSQPLPWYLQIDLFLCKIATPFPMMVVLFRFQTGLVWINWDYPFIQLTLTCMIYFLVN